MSLFNCNKCKRNKKASAELRNIESVYDTLVFCSDFSKEVHKFENPESYKEQLEYLYETNLELFEDSIHHARLKSFLSETEKALFDEIVSRPCPKLEFVE